MIDPYAVVALLWIGALTAAIVAFEALVERRGRMVIIVCDVLAWACVAAGAVVLIWLVTT